MEGQANTSFTGPAGMLQPLYALMPAQFQERAISLAVYPVMEGGRIRLSPADERAEEELGRLCKALEAIAPKAAADAAGWAAMKVRALLDHVQSLDSFKDDDLWCSALAGDRPLLVIKQAVLDERRLTLDVAVRRVHRSLVVQAVAAGLPVPPDVLAEHQVALGAGVGAERDL